MVVTNTEPPTRQSLSSSLSSFNSFLRRPALALFFQFLVFHRFSYSIIVSFSNLTTKCFNDDDTEDNLSCHQKEGKDYQEIFGATPVKIVEKMTIEGFLGTLTPTRPLPLISTSKFFLSVQTQSS